MLSWIIGIGERFGRRSPEIYPDPRAEARSFARIILKEDCTFGYRRQAPRRLSVIRADLRDATQDTLGTQDPWH